MSSITQNYKDLLKKIVERIDCSKLNVFQTFKNPNDIFNYVKFSDSVYQFSKDIFKEIFENLIIELDQNYIFISFPNNYLTLTD